MSDETWKVCPICMNPVKRGQTATMQNGLEFHSGCYANSLAENEKRQNEQFAQAMNIARKIERGEEVVKPLPTVGCCDDAIKTMLGANRNGIDINNIAVICLTCNRVWHTNETGKVERVI